MHSHHSHSGEFCAHATSKLDEVLSRAHELGFSHFHCSEHVPREHHGELYPEEKEAGLTPSDLASRFTAYLQAARERQTDYAARSPSMTVLVGCETENISSPGSMQALRRTLGSDESTPPAWIGAGRVDYLVGSVHHIHGIPLDFDVATYERLLKHSVARYTGLLDAYLDAQYEVLQAAQPEIIAHMDLYRLFEPNAPWYPDRSTSTGAAVLDKLERNICYAASYGALFEASSAAFRKSWKNEAYPGRVVLGYIKAAHGRIALSDDAHGASQVGLNYGRLRDYLLSEHIHEIWCLEPGEGPQAESAEAAAQREMARKARADTQTPGIGAPTSFPRGTRAVRYTDWASRPFWSSLPPDVARA